MEEPEIKQMVAIITPLEADLLRLVRLYDFGEVSLVDERDIDNPRKLRIKNRAGTPYQVVMEIQTNLVKENGLRLQDSVAIINTKDEKLLDNIVKELIHKIKKAEQDGRK